MVFDIGGVLEVTPGTGWHDWWAHHLSMAHLGMMSPDLTASLDEIGRAGGIGEITLPEAEQRIAVVLDLDQFQLPALMEALWAEYLGTLNLPMARYFQDLRPRYRTGILSNSFVGARERERAAYHFEDLCDIVVYSHEEGYMKPDPRIYAVVCDRLEVAASEVLFLDDQLRCVDGARDVGMTAVQFRDNDQALAALKAHLAGEP